MGEGGRMRFAVLATFSIFWMSSAWGTATESIAAKKTLRGFPTMFYRIEPFEIKEGVKLPFIEATRYLFGQDNSVRQAVIRGLATQANHDFEAEPSELLSVGTIRLSFVATLF